jgi:hypothetical protein
MRLRLLRHPATQDIECFIITDGACGRNFAASKHRGHFSLGICVSTNFEAHDPELGLLPECPQCLTNLCSLLVKKIKPKNRGAMNETFSLLSLWTNTNGKN